VQDVAEDKVSMTFGTVVEAVEPAEAIGWVVPAQDAAEATVVTLLGRIKGDTT